MMWQGFKQACKAEYFISRTNWRTLLLLLTPSFVALLHLLFIRIGNASNTLQQRLSGSENNQQDFAYGFYVDSLTTGLTVIYIVFMAVAAHSFASDRDSGVLRHLSIRQSSRTAILLAKTVALHVKALIACVVLFFLTLGLCALFWDFSAVIEDGYELISRDEIELEIQTGLTLALLPLPACLCLGILFSVLANSALQAVAMGLGATLFLDVFKNFLGNSAHYLYTSFQPSLLDTSYLKEVSQIARGFSDILIDERIMQLNYWMPIPQALVFVVVAFLFVKKKSL